jgi:hypothetical protein
MVTTKPLINRFFLTPYRPQIISEIDCKFLSFTYAIVMFL